VSVRLVDTWISTRRWRMGGIEKDVMTSRIVFGSGTENRFEDRYGVVGDTTVFLELLNQFVVVIDRFLIARRYFIKMLGIQDTGSESKVG